MATVEIEDLDKPSSLSNKQSYEQPVIKVAGFYTSSNHVSFHLQPQNSILS